MEVLSGKGNFKRRNKIGYVGEEKSGQRTACAKVLRWECVCHVLETLRRPVRGQSRVRQ